jgi:hypothetical protein
MPAMFIMCCEVLLRMRRLATGMWLANRTRLSHRMWRLADRARLAPRLNMRHRLRMTSHHRLTTGCRIGLRPQP